MPNLAQERVETRPTTLLLATDACCQAGYDTAEVELGGAAVPVLVYVTCTELWGRQESLRSWQEQSPECIAKAYPHGLPGLAITVRPLAEAQQGIRGGETYPDGTRDSYAGEPLCSAGA